MQSRSPSPSHQYGLWDLAEDFFSAIPELMAMGFSIFHLSFHIDPLAPDVLSGDPPPKGHSRFVLSWKALPGFSLSPELHQALLDVLPVRSIIHTTHDACEDWDRYVEYAIKVHGSGERYP